MDQISCQHSEWPFTDVHSVSRCVLRTCLMVRSCQPQCGHGLFPTHHSVLPGYIIERNSAKKRLKDVPSDYLQRGSEEVSMRCGALQLCEVRWERLQGLALGLAFF